MTLTEKELDDAWVKLIKSTPPSPPEKTFEKRVEELVLKMKAERKI